MARGPGRPGRTAGRTAALVVATLVGVVVAAGLQVGVYAAGGLALRAVADRVDPAPGRTRAAGPSVTPAATPSDGRDPEAGDRQDVDPQALARARDDAVERLLARLNALLVPTAGDPDAADLAPLVAPGRQDLATAWATDLRALRSVPFASVRYAWVGTRWRVPDDGLPRDGITATVYRVYSLGDPVPVAEPLEITVAPHGGTWLVVDKQRPVEGEAPEPWWAGPLAVERSGSVTVLGDPGADRSLRRLAALVDERWRITRAAWKLPRSTERVVVYASTNAWFQRTWLGGDAPVQRPDDPREAGGNDGAATFDGLVASRLSGSTEAEITDDDPDPVTRVRRVVVGAELLEDVTSAQTRYVVEHELVHLATDRVGDGSMVTWVTEGVADLQATQRLMGSRSVRDAWRSQAPRKAVRRALEKGTWEPELVVTPEGFYAGDESAVGDHYFDAFVALLYVQDRYGAAGVDRFVRGCLDHDPDTRGYAVGVATTTSLRAVTGLDDLAFAEEVAEFGNDLARRYGVTSR